jgi:iron complex outermembrane recepter protein
MRRFSTLALVASASMLALAAPAHAQDAESGEGKEDIIVTGTLVRGIAPAGTSVVGVTAEQVGATGATTVTELLTDVPQFGSFNSVQTLSGGGNFVTTNRPNLRSLPGSTTTGTSGTLMIVDGSRVVGMGIASTTPDADFIPPGIIERVDIIPDGGSALYGSDAVAGVVNFVTLRRFDGVKVDARYGFGDEFHTFDANVTVGKTWDRGSFWVSYNYAENSNILGKDRDYNFTPQARSTA